MSGTTIDKCKRGHARNAKSTRWITIKGVKRRRCRVCEADAFRLKYKANSEFRASKQAYNLKYYLEKVAPRHAVQNARQGQWQGPEA